MSKKKDISQYDFTPTQGLGRKREPGEDKNQPNIPARVVSMLLLLAGALYTAGHYVAVTAGEEPVSDITSAVINHITTTPMDFMHYNASIFAMVFLGWLLCAIFYCLPAQKPPKAEMKGEEHGSNDFQNLEERRAFIAKCTTPINMLDVEQVRAYSKAFHEKKGE